MAQKILLQLCQHHLHLLTFWVGLVDPDSPLESGLHLNLITFPSTIQQHLHAHWVLPTLLTACSCGKQYEDENEDATHCPATGRRGVEDRVELAFQYR